MAKRLTFTIEVEEPSQNDLEDVRNTIESEILERIRDIFINTVGLLDFCAFDIIARSTIENI